MSELSATVRLAARVARHSAAYTVGAALVAVIGIGALAVLTRLMAPGEYGKLALFLFVSSVLTLVYTVGSSQGILGEVFGRGEEGGDEDEDEDREPGDGGPDRERRRDALGTGLVFIGVVAGCGTAAIYTWAPELSELVFGDRDETTGIRLAGASGGLGALWRLLTAIPRLERRPTKFMLFYVGQPLLALVTSVPFVIHGHGAEGVLMGQILTTITLSVIALVAMRTAFRIRLRAELLAPMLRRGGFYVPLVLSNWIIGHSGVVILSRFVSGAEVGYFRVATVLGGIVMVCTSAFFMAWMPLKRTSAFKAANRERGIRGVSSLLTTWFTIGVMGMFVVVAAGADTLVRIAGPEYEPAARLIPFVAFAAVAQSAFLLSYRIAVFRHSRLALACLAPLAVATFIGSAVVLVPVLGSEGVPIATAIGFLLAGSGMLLFCQLGKRPIPFEYGRLARIALAAGLSVAAGHGLLAPAGVWAPAVSAGAVLCYPALLFALGVVSRREITVFTGILRTSLRPQRLDRPWLVTQLSSLSPEGLETLRLAAARRPARIAPPPHPGGAVEALRSVSEVGEPGEHDPAIGRYLLSVRSRADRDATARTLWHSGVDPSELDQLELTLDALRGLPARDWRTAARASAILGFGTVKVTSEPPDLEPLRRLESLLPGCTAASGAGQHADGEPRPEGSSSR